MNWSELEAKPIPLEMPGLLAFLDRWGPELGLTSGIVPATPEQIAALAAHYGGLDVLPPVYREFLATMGGSTGELGLTWGSTSIVDLLEKLEHPRGERADLRRYLQYSIGEINPESGKQHDDFFDLNRRTPDLRDAAVVRVREKDLVRGSGEMLHIFSTFSDFLRGIVSNKVWFEGRDDAELFWHFYDAPDATPRLFDVFMRLGFVLTELGASIHCIPLYHAERGAVARLQGPSGSRSYTAIKLYTPNPKQLALLREIIIDHMGS